MKASFRLGAYLPSFVSLCHHTGEEQVAHSYGMEKSDATQSNSVKGTNLESHNVELDLGVIVDG